MLRRELCLVLLSSAVLAATSYVPLGIDYTEWGPYLGAVSASPVQQIAADGSGDLYVLFLCSLADNAPSCLTKLSADGKTVVWQNTLTFTDAQLPWTRMAASTWSRLASPPKMAPSRS